jgi:hypothetical protein
LTEGSCAHAETLRAVAAAAVCAVAAGIGMGEVIAAHAVMFLEVADDRRRLNSRLTCGVTRRFWPAM